MRYFSYLIAAVLLSPFSLWANSTIDPNALSLLKRMSDSLANAKAFSYKSHSILEVPAITGQFITLFSLGEVSLRRPDMLRARLGGDAPRFDFYYDGKRVSSSAPGNRVYSQTNAPASIDEMLSGLHEETGVRFPSAPLLFSDPYAILTRNITSAMIVGPTQVNGRECDHLAFRSPGVNWEIWIDAGPQALPLRLAVTFIDQPNFPRTMIDFSHWNLHPYLPKSLFQFHKPSGFTEIPFRAILHSADR